MLDFSIVVFFIVIGLDLQRYNLFFNIQIFLQFFSFFFCDGLRRRFADYKGSAKASQTTSLQDHKTTSGCRTTVSCWPLAVDYWQAPHDSLSWRSFHNSVDP